MVRLLSRWTGVSIAFSDIPSLLATVSNRLENSGARSPPLAVGARRGEFALPGSVKREPGKESRIDGKRGLENRKNKLRFPHHRYRTLRHVGPPAALLGRSAGAEKQYSHTREERAHRHRSPQHNVDFPPILGLLEAGVLRGFKCLGTDAAKMDSVYVFYPARDHHVTRVMLARPFGSKRGRDLMCPPRAFRPSPRRTKKFHLGQSLVKHD
jgi:hypothetical protein